MSALGIPVLINSNRSYWLSSIAADISHNSIITGTIDANVGNISTLFANNATISSLNVSTLGLQSSDVSGMYVSSIRGNTAFFSSLSLASDLSGGLGYVRFSVDASGIQVDGDPIRFDNLVYLTSSINIIQVSTLVDTDIFGSNAYFSTLSTGNLSTGLASILQANISSLYVSSLEGFDISGADPVEWSLYPTLNSSITFNPGYVLSNVSQKLYFAGQEITDLSGGGQNWSQFPATQDVSMNNFSLRAISTLQFQDTARLYSQTGNNLFYNGQPIQYGTASNVSQWANYTAVNNVNMNTSSLQNVGNIGASNLALSGSNITNGNTFTNSLGVGGTSLVSLATITSGGDITCRNLDVGDNVTGLADVNIYGATAVPGDSALYVQGGVQFDGGTIHGFSAGVIPVGGINTGRIDMLQAGFNLLHPLVGAITTGAALSITAGGALSMAGGGYVEMNTSTLQMINTSQGNKVTTIQAGFLTIDPDVAPVSSIKLFNVLGGGVEIDGGGQGSMKGFSTIIGSNLSSINLDVSTINGVDWQDISGSVFTTISSFQYLQTSTFKVSTMSGTFGNNTLVGSTIFTDSGIQFVGETTGAPGGNRFLSSLRFINDTNQNLDVSVSTMAVVWNGGINSNGYVRIGEGGAFDGFFRTFNGSVSLSTPQILANSTIVKQVTTSSIGGYGGLPIKINNTLQFASLNAIDNVDVINLNPTAVPALNIGASTINLGAVNTFTQSLSTIRLSTSAFNFSSATCALSNTAFNVPLFIDYDSAGNTTTSGCAIRLAGHNLSAGAVRNELWMGYRASDGVNYIQAVWPGQNLEDLNLEGDPVRITDGALSTIFNQNPYTMQTTGGVSIGATNAPVILSTNLVKVGGQTNLTQDTISTTFMNTPYGNNMYTAGQRQPCVFFGNDTFPAGGGTTSTLITLPTAYTTKDFTAQITYKDSVDNTEIYWSTQTAGTFLAFGGSTHGFSWTTFGNLPFTG